jgi:response regulator RpfG family c-di-GMP phosphodiesterase
MQREVASPLSISSDEVLVFGSEESLETIGSVLRRNYRVLKTTDATVALLALRRTDPALSLLIADLDSSMDAPRVCEAATTMIPIPATVLVTTSAPEVVPAVLPVCDGVLLKPFAPNLLSARVARLIRNRSLALRTQSRVVLEKLALQRAKTDHLLERAEMVRNGTNIEWPNSLCPQCGHCGVTSFDYASRRRAWYACQLCKKVWLGKRQEQRSVEPFCRVHDDRDTSS